MKRPKLYLSLLVYNYDALPRLQEVRHRVESVGEAQVLAGRLNKLIGMNVPDNRTRGWLQKHHHIDGFVEVVRDLYQETTVRIPLQ